MFVACGGCWGGVGGAVKVVMVIMTSGSLPMGVPRSLSTGELIFWCVDGVLELYAPKGRMGSAKRNVYVHDLSNLKEDEFHDAYKAATMVSRFAQSGMSRNTHNSTFPAKGDPPKPHLSIQQWHSLQPETHATWDHLLDEAKAIILGLCKDPGKQTVNLHNISAYDFLQANLHESLPDDNGGSFEIPPDPNEDQVDADPQLDKDTSTALLAFLRKQKSTAHPGHLANILSTSKSKMQKEQGSWLNPMQVPPRMMRL